MSRYRPATQPTFYFIGVTTTSSSIMRVFPAWARHLGLKEAVLKGIDFPLHADPEAYRECVSFIKSDPQSLGALSNVRGVGPMKLERYGARFLAAITQSDETEAA